ncbi:hypothetical protein [Paraburkholderia caballeronis]|uniref:Uncharacterized protein n=1 Tax=Paraburkholderia caballeronis TaxID=416943 RepID=A0A1H7L146_9BURK|nr:hypothetical protein [Paraburkholderia caballeronis]PXW28240.1 hypothetical protein C7403_102132 [Paraburkholderia caballeronis]PXX03606.1 hypothetical protein C7407_102132 [Paraburkholderia caballeronis]RAK04350.1 hypothetical protein C7409_102132 [Paraburkholderia caballeronis]SED83775.1 hypothetical protein SAMN05445871_4047 [Paraburkholderia caballeronis]SEK92446.1 hypothetical protein SAMN05192542_104132 [Paraburkholderia caballeronis]
MSHRPNKRESAHMGRVAAMACICCTLLGRTQTSRTEVHHVRVGHGGAQRAGDFCTVPLCADDCHRGTNGVHGDQTYLRILKVTQIDLLNATIERLYGVAR